MLLVSVVLYPCGAEGVIYYTLSEEGYSEWFSRASGSVGTA